MKMTFDQYITNPNGQARGMMVAQRELAKQVYTDKYNKMMLRVAGMVPYELFKNSDESKYYIFFKMPSEGTKDLYYDTVIEFSTKDDVNKKINKINSYFVRFFSNDPNFTFTYAYVFNKQDLIIKELKNKISPEALKTRPGVTNPNKNVGYVKVFYFAYIYMKDHGLFHKLNWCNANTNKNNLIQRFGSVMNSDHKLRQAHDIKTINKENKNKKSNINTNKPDYQLSQQAKAIRTSNIHNRTVSIVDRERHRKNHSVKSVKTVKKIR